MNALLGAFTLNTIPYILLAILALLIMITIHELGHYTVGKLLGFGIQEFSLGFGKAIFQRQLKSGEKFSIRILPIGGYCAFLGEDADHDDPRAFNNKKPWQRILVLLAGVTFNFVFAMLILGIYFTAYGYNQPMVSAVCDPVADSAPSVFRENDLILKVNGKYVYTSSVSSNFQKLLIDGENTFDIVRDGEIIEVSATAGSYYYGEGENRQVSTGFGVYVTYGTYKFNFFASLYRGILFCFQIIAVTFGTIGSLFTGSIALKGNLGGTITTLSVVTQSVQQYGLRAFISLLGTMSAGIAIMNALPLPALDGSRVVFTLIEWIRGKPIKREIEGKIHLIGLAVLLLLCVVLDIVNLI